MGLGNPLEFDRWAEKYDATVQAGEGFPFSGYEQVLRRVVDLAAVQPSDTILDLGIGTGNLAKPFVELGCEVWGIDFSPRMLALVKAKLPAVQIAQADIIGLWPDEFCRRYDRLVSAYAFHHFDQAEKVDLLVRLSRDHSEQKGRIVVGDIAFPTLADLDDARTRWAGTWDEEHYWVVDSDITACQRAGLHVRYEQIGEFAGVFVVESSSPLHSAD